MVSQDYIDQQIQEKFLQLQEQFEGELIEIKEDIIKIKKGHIATITLIQEVTNTLFDNVRGNTEFITEGLLKIGKLLGELKF